MNASNFPGIDGFLGTRAPLMIDVVCIAMIGVVIVLLWSIYQVKFHRRYQLHKWTQITLGIVLLLTVTLFEFDIRLHGWQERAAGALGGTPPQGVYTSLYFHLIFAISTTVLWPVTIGLAMTKFSTPPGPSPHSRLHKLLGCITAADTVLTSITGWIFYWQAFVR